MSHPPLLGWICWPRATAQAEQPEAERLASGESLYRPPHEHKNGVGICAPFAPRIRSLSGLADCSAGFAYVILTGVFSTPKSPFSFRALPKPLGDRASPPMMNVARVPPWGRCATAAASRTAPPFMTSAARDRTLLELPPRMSPRILSMMTSP